MSGTITLTVLEGTSQGKTFVFDAHDTFLFGRMDDCHICLPHDQLVSRNHFLMEVNPPHACIRDLGSRNGTYVNGQKYGGREKHETPEEGARRQYPQVDLHDGDQVKVGATLLAHFLLCHESSLPISSISNPLVMSGPWEQPATIS